MGDRPTDQDWHGFAYFVAIGTVKATKTLSGRRKERRLIRSCKALMRILCCSGTDVVRIWPRNTHGLSDQSLQRILTMSHHVRVDGCVCGMREPAQGDLVWKPFRIQSDSAQVKQWFRGPHCSHPCRHEVCPNRYPRFLARRVVRGIMQFEHTTDDIVGWLKETEIENSQLIPSDVTGAEIENSEFTPNDVKEEDVECSKIIRNEPAGSQNENSESESRWITGRTSWVNT